MYARPGHNHYLTISRSLASMGLMNIYIPDILNHLLKVLQRRTTKCRPRHIIYNPILKRPNPMRRHINRIRAILFDWIVLLQTWIQLNLIFSNSLHWIFSRSLSDMRPRMIRTKWPCTGIH